MKKILYVITLGLLGACSSPKYTASFNSYDTNTGYHVVKKAPATKAATPEITTPPEVNAAEITASATTAPVIAPTAAEVATAKAEIKKAYSNMSKTERKEFRQNLKSLVKFQKVTKNMSVSSTKATKMMDHDLKLAAIFGAVGIVALLIGGNAFWIIGGVALIIGVVFFILWLTRQ